MPVVTVRKAYFHKLDLLLFSVTCQGTAPVSSFPLEVSCLTNILLAVHCKIISEQHWGKAAFQELLVVHPCCNVFRCNTPNIWKKCEFCSEFISTVACLLTLLKSSYSGDHWKYWRNPCAPDGAGVKSNLLAGYYKWMQLETKAIIG